MTDATAFSFSAAYDGARSVIERDGLTLTATIHADSDHGAPWDEEDGHGPVSDWRPVDSKAAGDLELNRDGRSARFYDFAEACNIARRDGWGVNGGKLEGETVGAYAARAARADFDRLKAWCADEWSYVGVAVTVARADVELVGKYDHALWGIESDAGDYLAEVAEELAGEATDAARAKLAELANT